MPFIEDVKHLQIPLQDIKLATNNFSNTNFIAIGGYGPVYKGISEKHGHIAIKRLDRVRGQGDHEFKTEIALLSKYKHANIVSLLGFCDEDGERVLVYKYESNKSLDIHLKSEDLTWIQRLLICINAAHGLKYLHDDVGPQHRIIHRDVKSSNILLDESWEPKISDFGLSKIGTANMQCTFPISRVCGTPGYIDPEYAINRHLTQKSDVYSFGVVLWEVLCGRLAHVRSYTDDRQYITVLVQKHCTRQTLDKIIPSYLREQINTASLDTFSKIAYQCLKNSEERPLMNEVAEQLEKALHDQLEGNEADKEANPPPAPPPPQEVALTLKLDCKGCATRVRQCLKNFEGVEDVVTDLETHKVVVKGKKVDHLKVLKKVQTEIRRKVELLLPVPKPSAEEPRKPEQEEPHKQDETKDEPMSVTTVVLKIDINCEACAQKIRKDILMMKGVESAVPDIYNSQVLVKGSFPTTKLLDHVHKKTGKKALIVNQTPYTS